MKATFQNILKSHASMLTFALILMLSLALPLCTANAASLTQGPTASVSAKDTSVTVSWKSVSGALYYDLELYTADNYQKMLKENGTVARYSQKLQGLKVTTKTLNLQPGSYVVTVAAVNASSWKFGNAVAFTVGSTRWLHGVPNWKQYDSKWQSTYINTKTIGQVGCALTSLSMAESYRTKGSITPVQMKSKISFSGNDLCWPSNYYTMSSSLDLKLIYNTINNGKPVIIGAQKSNGGWHWVIVVGYVNANPSKLTADMFAINDPNSTNTSLAVYLKTYNRVGCLKTYQ